MSTPLRGSRMRFSLRAQGAAALVVPLAALLAALGSIYWGRATSAKPTGPSFLSMIREPSW